MQTLEFVAIVPWNLIFQWCNLLILFLLVKKFLFKPVQNILAKRQEEIERTYQDADVAKAAAEEMRADYEQHLAAAKEEASEIVKSATLKAQAHSDELISEAQQKASSMIEKANAEIALEKKKAVNETKDEISGIAMDIASKVVEREISAADHEKLIEEFINNVGEAS